ncbi:CarD family transcriptional regulator [Bacillus testis]|uniref:CarD family transcriptional regulator n=1 Tax=Bacillus testis TaxID=1622072 RepID=UPI00067EE2C5|nr:CarD family transcriptional regulator [Bacillus testis]
MFQVGDKVVYPIHGAGIIEAIEDKEILGEHRQYYIIQLSLNDLQIMCPLGNEEKLGLRPVTDAETMKTLLDRCRKGETDRLLPSKQRIKVNSEKLKTGNIREAAEVVRDLTRMQEEKPLNSSEKQMLNKARGILLSELKLVNGISDMQIKNLSLV